MSREDELVLLSQGHGKRRVRSGERRVIEDCNINGYPGVTSGAKREIVRLWRTNVYPRLHESEMTSPDTSSISRVERFICMTRLCSFRPFDYRPRRQEKRDRD